MVFLFFFFFFQAEDGIRDTSVTGVQTCALPICADAFRPAARGWCAGRKASARSRRSSVGGSGPAGSAARSEERRVGKECRCRWWPDDGKKRKTRGREECDMR